MIKELKLQKAALSGNENKSHGIGSIDFVSNASTREFYAGVEERDRAKKIMQEPIESLVFGSNTNIHSGTRPISHELKKPSKSSRKGNMNIINNFASKKERAMTAGHNKRHGGYSRGLAKI